MKVICPNCDGEGRVPPFEPWDSEMVDVHPKYRNMSSWPQCPKCKGHGWSRLRRNPVDESMLTPDPMHEGSLGKCCYDCRRAYGSFPDLVLPAVVWARISPKGDDGGLLCPSCICERMDRAGIRGVPYFWGSGPFATFEDEREKRIFDWKPGDGPPEVGDQVSRNPIDLVKERVAVLLLGAGSDHVPAELFERARTHLNALAGAIGEIEGIQAGASGTSGEVAGG